MEFIDLTHLTPEERTLLERLNTRVEGETTVDLPNECHPPTPLPNATILDPNEIRAFLAKGVCDERTPLIKRLAPSLFIESISAPRPLSTERWEEARRELLTFLYEFRDMTRAELIGYGKIYNTFLRHFFFRDFPEKTDDPILAYALMNRAFDKLPKGYQKPQFQEKNPGLFLSALIDRVQQLDLKSAPSPSHPDRSFEPIANAANLQCHETKQSRADYQLFNQYIYFVADQIKNSSVRTTFPKLPRDSKVLERRTRDLTTLLGRLNPGENSSPLRQRIDSLVGKIQREWINYGYYFDFEEKKYNPRTKTVEYSFVSGQVEGFEIYQSTAPGASVPLEVGSVKNRVLSKVYIYRNGNWGGFSQMAYPDSAIVGTTRRASPHLSMVFPDLIIETIREKPPRYPVTRQGSYLNEEWDRRFSDNPTAVWETIENTKRHELEHQWRAKHRFSAGEMSAQITQIYHAKDPVAELLVQMGHNQVFGLHMANEAAPKIDHESALFVLLEMLATMYGVSERPINDFWQADLVQAIQSATSDPAINGAIFRRRLQYIYRALYGFPIPTIEACPAARVRFID